MCSSIADVPYIRKAFTNFQMAVVVAITKYSTHEYSTKVKGYLTVFLANF